MKVKYNEEEIISLSNIRKKVIANDISIEELDGDLKRRLCWVITHKYERCMERLKNEWIPKLKKSGITSIPLDDDKLAELIFSQTDYKDRFKREGEKK